MKYLYISLKLLISVFLVSYRHNLYMITCLFSTLTFDIFIFFSKLPCHACYKIFFFLLLLILLYNLYIIFGLSIYLCTFFTIKNTRVAFFVFFANLDFVNHPLSVETYKRINFIKKFYLLGLKNRPQMWKQLRPAIKCQ